MIGIFHERVSTRAMAVSTPSWLKTCCQPSLNCTCRISDARAAIIHHKILYIFFKKQSYWIGFCQSNELSTLLDRGFSTLTAVAMTLHPHPKTAFQHTMTKWKPDLLKESRFNTNELGSACVNNGEIMTVKIICFDSGNAEDIERHVIISASKPIWRSCDAFFQMESDGLRGSLSEYGLLLWYLYVDQGSKYDQRTSEVH